MELALTTAGYPRGPSFAFAGGKSRIGGFLILLAGFVFLHFAATIRSVLGSAEATLGGSVQLARVAFAGALTGITGIPIAMS